MRLCLDRDSRVPYDQQVALQIKHLVASGALAPGDRLPSVREMAAELTLNPNMIERAYEALEREQIVETRWHGIVVQRLAADAANERKTVAALIDQALGEAQRLGLTREDALALLQDRVEEIYGHYSRD